GGESFEHTRGWELYMELPDSSLRLIENQSLKAPVEVSTWGQPKPTIFTAPHTGRYFIRLFAGLGPTGYELSLRHYVAAPGSAALDQRDIVLVSSRDGGQTWSPKVRVNHDPAGSDQAMPNVAVDGLGRVYVAW